MPYTNEVLADAPFAYWRLAETSGTTATNSGSSGATLNGTYSGTYTQNSTSLLTTDTANKAVIFAGAGYINVPYNAAINLTGDFTLELWAKSTLSGSYPLLSHEPGYRIDTSGNSFRALVWNSTAGVAYQVIEAAYTQRNDGLPHHVVLTKSGTTLSLYVDGALVGTNPNITTPLNSNTTDPLRIGSTSSATGGWNGTVDEVAMYNTVLSAARVLVHYQAGIGAITHTFDLTDAVATTDSLSVNIATTFSPAVNVVSTLSMGSTATMALNDAVNATTELSANTVCSLDMADAVDITDAVELSKLIEIALSANTTVTSLLGLSAVMRLSVSSAVTASVVIQAGDYLFNGWIVNPKLAASAMLDGFEFNSFAKYKGRSYGISNSGIYELGGETDDGADISSFVGLPKVNFGTAHQKRVPHAYIGASGEKLVLRVVVDDVTYTYEADNPTTELAEQKFDLGKGLKGNYWQFELVNTDGEDFELDTIKFMPIVLERRR